jgi:hypothetical protein
MWTWTAVVVGYVAPSVVAGLGLGLVGDAIERWARRATQLG